MVNTDRQPIFHLDKVWANNFRSIASTTVDLERLTVFVGPNASGKSNLLDVLRFIKDALHHDLDAAISMRQGFEAISRRVSKDCPANIEIGITARTRGYESSPSFLIDYSFLLKSDHNSPHKVDYEFAKIWTIGERKLIAEFRIEQGNIVSPNFLVRQHSIQPSFSDEYDSDFDPIDLNLPTLFRFRRPLIRDSVELELSEPELTNAVGAAHRLFRHLRDMRFYHIFPNTIREPKQLTNANYLDEDAANLASVLREMEKRNSRFLSRLKDGLGSLIPGVTDLDVTSAGGYLVVRLKHESKYHDEWFDLSQESDGTIRLLGILTALNQRRYVQLIGIEEPELTVHPGAMPVLADLLKEFSRRSQLIVTTHSPDLIDCLSDYRSVENLRLVDLVEGTTTVREVSETQSEDVKRHLFSPGELHRMGQLTLPNPNQ